MSIASAHRFVNDLVRDPTELLAAAELPDNMRRAKLREMGYDFTPQEIDAFICGKFLFYKDMLNIGEGDVRDIIMQKWGKCMK